MLFYTVNTYPDLPLCLHMPWFTFPSHSFYLTSRLPFLSLWLLQWVCINSQWFLSLSENIFICLAFVFCYQQLRMFWHEFHPFQPVCGSLNFLKHLYQTLKVISHFLFKYFSAPHSSSSPFRSWMTIMLNLLFFSSRSQDSIPFQSFFSVCITLDNFCWALFNDYSAIPVLLGLLNLNISV